MTAAPEQIGHLMELPLENGDRVLIDPHTIVSVSAHRTRGDITVVRCAEGSSYTGLHFVTASYETVRDWLDHSIRVRKP